MSSTLDKLSTAPEPVAPAPRGAGPVALARRWWRALTSMRTALVLLFLLAVAAVPGSLLPQRSLNLGNVAGYFAEHPDLAPWLDRLRLFDVFSSPWFAAIYLLLFVSLLGCIVPRTRQHWRVVRQPPPSVPARLDRLTLSRTATVDRACPEVADTAVAALKAGRWRVVRRERAGVVEVSAEKGYLREVGNLTFHGALVVLLVGLAYGRLAGYEGSILVEEGSGFCNSFQQYDTYRNGPLAEAGDLSPLCADLQRFSTEYEADFTPTRFRADIIYTRELGGPEASYPLEVNSPLRTDGVRLYLTGHGYSPRFTITYPDGSRFTDLSAPFLPEDPTTLASSGVIKLPDRPGVGGDADEQLAIEGFFVPTATAAADNRLISVDPRPQNPAVAIVVYRGSLGLDSGAPQNVFRLDQVQIERGVLTKVGSGNLFTGQSLTLPDGTEIRFEGYRQWAALQLSYDPAQLVVLGAAIAALAGLLGSLLVRRRRLWIRCVPAGPAGAAPGASRTVVAAGGLARSDNPGFAAEFQDLVGSLTGRPLRED